MLGEDQAEDRLRELLRDPGWSLPKWRDPQQRIRRAARGQRVRLAGTAAGVAAALTAVAVPVGIGASGQVPGPAGPTPRAAPTLYAAYTKDSCLRCAAVIPIKTATDRARKPIPVGGSSRLGGPDFIAITPDGKTAYVANAGLNAVTPISTATNTPGKPIHVPLTDPITIAIGP